MESDMGSVPGLAIITQLSHDLDILHLSLATKKTAASLGEQHTLWSGLPEFSPKLHHLLAVCLW